MPPEEGLPPERRPRNLDEVRFYVDEDLRPVGAAMMWTRRDVVVCDADLIRDDLPRGKADEEWIPVVAARGWIAVTGNVEIRRNPVESALAVRSRLRVVCVHDETGKLTMWAKLALVTRHWSGVEAFVDRHPTGPWWISVTASGYRELAYSAISSV